MNILTFDIEDWYCHDNLTRDFAWEKHECRIYEGTDRILDELSRRNQKATFFCLGWLAEHHPQVIKKIHEQGHQIGCHSYQHELASRFDKKGFHEDVAKAQHCIEDAIGDKVELFRAPAFSITKNNLYAFEVLHELGFTTDCSIFPAIRDYGGMPEFGFAEPGIISYNGATLKEFPINIKNIMGHDIVFSGGGYFRLFPYWMIKKYTKEASYVMCYLHPSDFDPNQPKMHHLPILRQWKNQVGLKSSFHKFQRYLDDFKFINISEANQLIDWNTCKKVNL